MKEKLVLIQDPESSIKTNSYDRGLSFSLPQLGLWCPMGKDFLPYERFRPKDSYNTWIFIITNEKKWLLEQLKTKHNVVGYVSVE